MDYEAASRGLLAIIRVNPGAGFLRNRLLVVAGDAHLDALVARRDALCGDHKDCLAAGRQL